LNIPGTLRQAGLVVSKKKLKRRAHAALLQRQPWCIYCGGTAPATTIDHMPPRMMFRGKDRPKGLEFPSCEACNVGTRLSDLVASLLGRIYPDSEDAVHRSEVRRLMDAVGANVPGVLSEMYLPKGRRKLARSRLGMPVGEVLRADGPLLTKHMLAFAAKLGLALHFEATGRCIPRSGRVRPAWFSNAQAFRGDIPPSLTAHLPPSRTLRQGRKHVGDQFRYSWLVSDVGFEGVFYASFRESFAVAALTAFDPDLLTSPETEHRLLVAPGDLPLRHR
jgi:hypothetical protein